MNEVYIVTKGDYSDYHICGVYLTRELAEKAQILFNGEYDKPNIEVWKVDTFVKEFNENGLLPFKVYMDIQGEAEVSRGSVESYVERTVPYGDDKRIVFELLARDEEHAKKIANERRMLLIANNKFITNWSKWTQNGQPKLFEEVKS